MEVIVDELRKTNVNIDVTTLSRYINKILDRHEKLYLEMASHLSPDIYKMNVNNFGRARAYLTLLYQMNISEDGVRCEAV